MPLVETAGNLPSSYYCRTTSCVENPQATAMDALKVGDLRLLSDLLSDEGNTVDPDQEYPAETFKTLLQVAVEAGRSEAVKILLAGGARADHYNSALKLTPVHVAAMTGDNNLLALLLTSCSTPGLDLKDRAGRTALHQAVSLGHLDCVRALCQRGASVNLTDNKGGQTPLHLAASAANYDLVRLLLSYGAALRSDTEAVIRKNFSSVVRQLFVKSPSIV